MHRRSINDRTLMQNRIIGQVRYDPSMVMIGQRVVELRCVLCDRCHGDGGLSTVSRFNSRVTGASQRRKCKVKGWVDSAMLCMPGTEFGTES